MTPPRAGSLREALATAASLDARMLFDIDGAIPFGDLRDGTALACDRADLTGRNVLLSTAAQRPSALALIALDGVAGRVVVCPPDLRPADLPVVARHAEIDLVVTDDPDGEAMAGLGLPIVRCGLPLRSTADAGEAAIQPHRATEWLLLTSGTTGVPKLVQHSFAGLTAAIVPRPIGARPTVWATFYDMRRFGGLQIFLRGILGTGSLVLSAAGEPVAAFLQRLGAAGVTHVSGTPSHWRRALMSPEIAAITPDYVRLSGEIADQAVLDALRAAFPSASVGHAYASTEAGVGFEVNDGLAGFPAALIGQGDDVEMKVIDGSLRIRSSRAASRYVGTDDLVLADPDGFVDTGDMVEARDGRYHFVGRRGGIINVGGLKVHPEEVEAVINRHPGVQMSLVEGRKNPITGAIVTAAVVLGDAEASASTRDGILAACRSVLPAHKVPAILRFVPTLAVTPAGKLVRVHG